jgi:hypothetical protein
MAKVLLDQRYVELSKRRRIARRQHAVSSLCDHDERRFLQFALKLAF